MADGNPFAALIDKRAGGFNNPSQKSHYRDPIIKEGGRLAGNSRKVGDASPNVKYAAINAIVASAKRSGLTLQDAARVLSMARNESGFNPDAAAGTSTAVGLGQLIDATWQSISKQGTKTGPDRWDVGSGLVDNSQKMRVAAKVMAEKKVVGQRS